MSRLRSYANDIIYIFVAILVILSIHFILGPRVVMSNTVKKKLDNVIYLQLKDGMVVIEMLPEVAPNHVERIKMLTKQKFYDGSKFHRVIAGFMVQTGANQGADNRTPYINAEFSKLQHKRGAVSMARANDINSADTQFFIVTDDSFFLDGKYTIFGYVTSGMEYVDKITKGDNATNGMVSIPDKIISMRIATDVEYAKAMNADE